MYLLLPLTSHQPVYKGRHLCQWGIISLEIITVFSWSRSIEVIRLGSGPTAKKKSSKLHLVFLKKDVFSKDQYIVTVLPIIDGAFCPLASFIIPLYAFDIPPPTFIFAWKCLRVGVEFMLAGMERASHCKLGPFLSERGDSRVVAFDCREPFSCQLVFWGILHLLLDSLSYVFSNIGCLFSY